MYGTIGRLRARQGKAAELVETYHRHAPEYRAISGAIALYLFKLDRDPQDLVMVAVFDSRETYLANSRSPSQAARSSQVAPLLDGEPAWQDGEIIDTGLRPNSRPDEATYGTVGYSRLKDPPGPEIEEVARRLAIEDESVPGAVFNYIFQPDSDPQGIIAVVGFESRDAYWSNAASPDQDRRYRELRALLESDPDWNDGEIIAFVRF